MLFEYLGPHAVCYLGPMCLSFSIYSHPLSMKDGDFSILLLTRFYGSTY